VSTLWQVNDRVGRQIFERFHRALTRGVSPSRALRDAQLSMIAAGTAFRHPRHWGAYIVIGGTNLGVS
jgi:CHAT domain-containing protein